MKLYEKYIKERLGHEILYNKNGFIQFSIEKDVCFIAELFVDESKRSKGLALSMVNDLVELVKSMENNKQVKRLVATIYTNTEGYERVLCLALRYGFHIISMKENESCIILQKEL